MFFGGPWGTHLTGLTPEIALDVLAERARKEGEVRVANSRAAGYRAAGWAISAREPPKSLPEPEPKKPFRFSDVAEKRGQKLFDFPVAPTNRTQ
jgi:hypothetical protein